jgi:uncharacterized membrane protein YkvA (DUF1232 family)
MTIDDQDITQEENVEAAETSLTSRVKDEGFWRELWHQVRLVWYLVRDPDVPFYLKALPLAAVLYVLIPTDLIPDVLPGLGQLDDITALVLGGKIFIELAPPHVVSRYLEAMRRHKDNAQGDREINGEPANDNIAESIIIEGEYEEVEASADELTS